MSRILLSAYACEPGRGSEAEVGWMWATELEAVGHEVWVITREANRQAIESGLGTRRRAGLRFAYYDLPRGVRRFKSGSRGVHWYYALWQWGAYLLARRLTRTIQFGGVHHVTFVGLRAPSFMGWLGLPFYLGPVSGGEKVPHRLRKGMSWRARCRERIRDAANWLLGVDPIMRAGFRRAEKIALATRESQTLVPQRYRDKCSVQLGVGLSREYLAWTSRRPVSKGKLRLLYAGRLLEWKRIDLGLRAIAAVRAHGIAVQFTIVGSGPAEARLRGLAGELEIESLIHWIGWVPRDQLEYHYRQHDVLLFPSLRDSGGMVVLEALAHGLPVICTDCGGPGVIVNERCGRVVATRERAHDEVVATLANSIRNLSRDRVLLNKLSVGARTRAWEFDFRKVVERAHPPCQSEAMTGPIEQAVS